MEELRKFQRLCSDGTFNMYEAVLPVLNASLGPGAPVKFLYRKGIYVAPSSHCLTLQFYGKVKCPV